LLKTERWILFGEDILRIGRGKEGEGQVVAMNVE